MPALPRVFLSGPLAPGSVSVPSEAARRLSTVLRLSPGNAFMAFCGDGGEYPAVITHVSGKRVMANLQPVARQEPPPALCIELHAGLVRANRFDMVVEKCTEVGADVIAPLLSQRSARGDSPSESRYERWERIAVEAAEQSGRLYLPVMAQPQRLEQVLERESYPLLMPHPREMPWAEAAKLLPERGTVGILIGPEGGFNADEIALARRRGAILTSIAPNILRTETAAMVSTALVRAARL